MKKKRREEKEKKKKKDGVVLTLPCCSLKWGRRRCLEHPLSSKCRPVPPCDAQSQKQSKSFSLWAEPVMGAMR